MFNLVSKAKFDEAETKRHEAQVALANEQRDHAETRGKLSAVEAERDRLRKSLEDVSEAHHLEIMETFRAFALAKPGEPATELPDESSLTLDEALAWPAVGRQQILQKHRTVRRLKEAAANKPKNGNNVG